MNKLKFAGLVFACMAVIFFLTDENQSAVTVMSDIERWIPVVMKDDSGLLVPLHVKSACTTDAECLNESLNIMSSSFEDFQKTVPVHISVNSLDCSERCTADLSKEILEYNPAHEETMKQVIHYLFEAYGIDELTVQDEASSLLGQDAKCFLNQTHFLEEDYQRGNLYQMYMLKEASNQILAVPVVVHMEEDDPLSAIERYYSSSASVQFDNVVYQQVEITEGEPLTLNLSGECIVNTEVNDDLILPILYSIQHVFDASTVRVVVDGVYCDEYSLSDLKINEFFLAE